MTQRQQWPEDMEFRRFAAKVADGVTVHINSGGKITTQTHKGRDASCRCPLGTVDTSDAPYPPSEEAARIIGCEEDWALCFLNAFEDDRYYRLEAFDGASKAAYRLGRAYRKRFVEGA